MKARTRLTLLFTLITATILLVFAFVIYYSASESREKEFYTSLKKEAITKANLFLNAKVDAKTLQDIYRSNREILNEVEVAIYTIDFNLLYHDAVDIDFVKEDQKMIDEISRKGEIYFSQENWQVVGMRYHFEDENYIVIAAAYDQYGYNKLYSLLRTSIIVFIISVLFIYIAGRFFSIKAFEPVTEMTHRAKDISATNLDLRLKLSDSKDEMRELAETFNEMLDRLENSFEAQKQFLTNISHELRTPLAAIITELELSANKERSVEEYKTVIQNSWSDAKKIVRLSNNLLDLARASYDPAEISFKETRIDEVLLEAQQQVQQGRQDCKILIHYEKEIESDHQISIYGNRYLLKVAFANLFENACKFSENAQSKVAISFDEKSTILKFSDEGIGISEEDLKNIFSPFFRGENKVFAEGHGIGLSLTEKIIHLHQGRIEVESESGKGSCFTVLLPHK